MNLDLMLLPEKGISNIPSADPKFMVEQCMQ